MRVPGLDSAPVVLDGGLATELESRGHDLSDALWSARLLLDAPEEILAAHETFFRSGARIATTASYQATFPGFRAGGTEPDEAAMLLRRSVELARTAGNRVLDDPFWIAASVGPYGAMLADGAEYRGRYGLSPAELSTFHRPRLEVLAAAEPDVFALETIPDIDEAAALVSALPGIGIPAWISYTVADNRTRAGQPLAEAFSVAAESKNVFAIGVNCCSPSDAEAAIQTATEVTDKPVIVYPNSGELWDPRSRQWAGPSRFSAELVRRCSAKGARIIGGCCRVGPSEIRMIADLLDAAP